MTREALRLLDRHQPFVRATVVRTVGSAPGKVGATLILRADGSFVGTVGGAALEERVKALAREAFQQRRSDLHHFELQTGRPGGLPSLCGGAVDIAVEYVRARAQTLIWGGGHVAQAFAELLTPLEVDFAVADDRPEWVAEARFPRAARREVVAPGELWSRFDPAEFSHLYVLGYDAAKDLEVLAGSAGRFGGIVGLIASRTKRERMLRDLRGRGVPPAWLARIRSPVGLAIGAESPAEIAVSMAAELVQDHHAENLPTRAHAGSEAESEQE
ncbi:MAG: XdhC family protein [Thermoplasmata archaeon]